MALELVTPPSEEPVTLDEAKTHLRVDITSDDALITRQIVASRRWCEQQAGRAFVTQTWRLWLDAFPDGTADQAVRLGLPIARVKTLGIDLPYPRLVSVSNVKYTDTAGAVQTLDPTAYIVDNKREPGRVLPAYATVWPFTREVVNAVQVEYVAGYGAAAAVDERAKQAILLIIGHWYQNREEVLVGTISKEIETAAKDLMRQLWDGCLR